MKRTSYSFLLVILSVLTLLSSIPVRAEMFESDLELLIKSLGYINELSDQSKLSLTIAFDPDSESSKAESEFVYQSPTIQKEFSRVFKKTIKQVISQANADLIYVAARQSKMTADLLAHTKNKRIFAVSVDKECVLSGLCVLSITTRPILEIYLNDNTLKELGFHIDPVFKFMVKRLGVKPWL